jgi:electron transfer flavoprotein beta subunit
MNLVVAMKQIPDLQQIRFSNRRPVLADVPKSFGNIDKNALEAAVLIKESYGDGKVTVLSAGNEELEDTIKEALAAGADEAFLITDDNALDDADSSIVAQVLTEAIKQLEDVDLLLFGEGSGNNYSGQMGPRVAKLLDLPMVGYASAIEIKGDTAVVVRTLEDVEEVVEVSLPAVITVQSGINEPRIPSVTQILKAGRKPKTVQDLEDLDLGSDHKNQVVTIDILAPESNRKQIKVNNASQLLDALKNENLIGG